MSPEESTLPHPRNSRDRWHVVGASVQGESHRRSGQPCQDAHRWREMEGGILIAAVADGAGSAACSDIGSALAAQAAIDELGARLSKLIPTTEVGWQALLAAVFEAVRQDLLKQGSGLDFSPPDLATTLLVAVATPQVLAAGQIGDGAVVARLNEDRFQAMTQPQAQEYINETTFLTSPAFIDQAQFVVHPEPVTGLALFTDGLQMLAPKMPQASPHPAFFSPLLRLLAASPERDRAEAQLRGFLQSPRITQRADDDLTLVLAIRD